MADTTMRNEELKFEALIPSDLKTLYADGFSGMMLGFPNSKILFHSVRNTGGAAIDGFEQRVAIFEMALPTSALIELCRKVLIASADSQDVLIEGGSEILDRVKKMLSDVSFSEVPAKH